VTIAAGPGYRRLELPLPFALRSVNAYLVEGDRGVAIVDCGLHTDEAERALTAGLVDAGRSPGDVQDVFVTHLHPDHIGMAGWLERAGARVHMHAPEAEAARAMWFAGRARIDVAGAWFRRHGMPPDVIERMAGAWLATQKHVDPIARMHGVRDGEVLTLAGRRFRLIWTPGHTDYHAVLLDLDERVLLAGDHVLPAITPNIGFYPFSREDPLADFIGALERVCELDVKRVLPAHGDPFDDLRGRAREIIAHHRARLDAVRDALSGGGLTAYAVARVLFPSLKSAHEERFAHAEVLAHLRYLQRRGQVAEEQDEPVLWRLSREPARS
jgi:glyoxylase-like metal-dependent hydrolase (beta-lactamase superfamily II)